MRSSTTRAGSCGVLVVALVALATWAAAPAADAEGEPARLDLQGTWRAWPGEHSGPTHPPIAAADGVEVRLPASWFDLATALPFLEQNGLDGELWLRRDLELPPDLRQLARRGDLALHLGPPVFGAYRVWAGGERVGGSVGWDLSLPVPRETVVPIPSSAVADDGSLSLTLQLRSVGWASRRSPVAAPLGDTLALGSRAAMEQAVEARRNRRLLEDVPLLLLAVLFLVAAAYHGLLYLRRRREVAYLWFALLSASFALNTLCLSWWVFEMTARRDLVLRLGDLSGHLTAALAIQFLWTFYERPIGRWLRAYQLSHVALALLLAFWPSPAVVLDTVTWRWLWLLPLLVAASVLVLRELRHGRPEARVLAIGGLVLVLTQIHELVGDYLPWAATRMSLVPFGFAVVLVTMAWGLSQRFRNLLGELEALRGHLEERISERTYQLEERNAQLERRNQELLRSRRQREQVFSTLSEMMEGRILDDKYRLEEKIGSGGFAAVYRARHLTLDRPVAVKIFQPSRFEGTDSGEGTLERFRREGISACRVDHPNAVMVLDSGIAEGNIAYLVLELLQGHDLGQELRRQGRLSPRRCGEILLPVCRVLDAAAEAGVVHRDIKPANIFLHQTPAGEVVKVVDFGIAKWLGEDLSTLDLGSPYPATRAGHVLGTPPYMAPERLLGEPYDERADIYGLGVVLYEMLSGRRPFQTASGQLDYRRLFRLEPPEPLRTLVPEVGLEIEGVVLWAMATEPAARPTARQLADGFERALAVADRRRADATLPGPADDGESPAVDPPQDLAG